MPFRNLVLVTGASGLIGSEVSSYFAGLGYAVHGVDNNQRAVFFGPQGDTRWNQRRLERDLPTFRHHELDIRDRQGVLDLVAALRPSIIVHAAAQPSHDRAAAIPFDDFDTNAVGTLNVLEAARRSCPESPFVFLSTNLEAFALVEQISGQRQRYTYVETNRMGDHICYYSDLRKMRDHYPGWDLTVSLEQTIAQIVEAWQQKLVS